MKGFSSTQLQHICQAVRQAGQRAKRMAATPLEISQKGPSDFVTNVDRALDHQLTVQFRSWFAQDGVITEENPASLSFYHQGFSRLWLIDPLDGTEDFIHGRIHYAVMVGLLEQLTPTAGWIYSPVRDQMYFGGVDWGLFRAQGQTATTAFLPHCPEPPSATYCPILIGHRDASHYWEAITQVIPEAQSTFLGSFGLKVMEVIQGRAGLYIYLNGRVKLWDTTGPVALAQAAGLVCCDLEGNPLQFSPEAINLDTLAHQQSIVIGWPHYIDALLPRLQQAIALTESL